MGKYRLNYEDFLWLWRTDYYDGFMAGFASYKKQPVYLKCNRDSEFYKPGPIVNGKEDYEQRKHWYARVFGVYKISYESFWNATVDHLKWRECVGWDNDLEPAHRGISIRGTPHQRRYKTDDRNWDEMVDRKGYDVFKEWRDKNPIKPLDLSRDNFIGYLWY